MSGNDICRVIARLQVRGHISDDEATGLVRAYAVRNFWWRNRVEHRLQIASAVAMVVAFAIMIAIEVSK